MVLISSIKKGEQYDAYFKHIIPKLNYDRCVKKDDDVVVMAVGEPGTGKSMLGLHAYDLIDPEGSVEQIGMDPSTFARAMNNAKDAPKGKRFINYDESMLNKRQWASKWNNAVIDLYSKIRGKNIFHWLCTPQADRIDSHLLDRVDLLVYIFSKSTTKPRLYAVFDNSEFGHPPYVLKTIKEKYGDLSFKSLDKAIPKYASWVGSFKDYKGHLRPLYDSRKDKRQDFIIEEFTVEWGNADMLGLARSAALLGIDERTAKKYYAFLIKENLVELGKQIIIDKMGRYRVKQESLNEIGELIRKNFKKIGGRVGDTAYAAS